MLAARSTNSLDRVVKEVRTDGGFADAVILDLVDRASIRARYKSRIGTVRDLASSRSAG